MSLPPAPAQPKRILRVSEVTRYLKQLMEKDTLLSRLQVQGEVTNLSRAGSGWVYFSIKDNLSQLGCVVPRQQAVTIGAELANLQNGISVLVEGSVAVYEPRGVYQLSVNRMRIGGVGVAQARFERLRQKLETEGLFASERKRSLPSFPDKLVLITAPDSDAYHDVMRRLQQQWPRVTVIVAGVTVQGEHAAGQIATAIDIANRSTEGEVILLVRGGGAAEELDAFNDERLARAIFASHTPIVTGIGHTANTTIADLVADVQAPTPTAAAGIAVPDGPALTATCNRLHRQMRAYMDRGLKGRRTQLVRLESMLMRSSPQHRLNNRRQRLDDGWNGLGRTVSIGLDNRRRRLEALQRQLDALNPQSVLGRGYALLTDIDTGVVVSSTGAASPGRKLLAQVKDGSFQVTVGNR